MSTANASEWIDAGKKVGTDLSFLHQDKLRIYDMLEMLNLPRPKVYTLQADQVNYSYVEALFKVSTYFCRLIPHNKDAIRPYRLRLSSFQEFREFCSQYDLTKYTIQLVEKGTLTHTGCIIATDEKVGLPNKCVVELVEGDAPNLFHGRKIPIHAEVNWSRAIRYESFQKPNDIEKNIIYGALRMIDGPRHPFPGYYEFDVWYGNRIIFRNYQGPETAYAKL